MIKKLIYAILLFLTLPSLAPASQATLASWTTPTGCIITCPSYTAAGCPVSGPTQTTVGCDTITGYRFHSGSSHGVYTISSDVSVTNAASLTTVTGALPRGYICTVVTALTAAAESGYSNELCFWNLGNSVYSNNATRPVPSKPGAAGSGTYVSDNFDRADGSLGSNWTTVSGAGAMQISGNRLMGTGTANAIYWSANPFSNDQCSQIWMLDTGATYGGPAVYVSPTQHSYYDFKVLNGGSSYRYAKNVNGAWSQLGATISGSPQPNDVLTLCISSGHVLTGFVNGSPKETRTDTDLNSGRAGITLDGTVTRLDNWIGWDGTLLPFAATQYVQAEAGTLSGMSTGVSGTDTYVYTTTNNAGYARFQFNVTTQGTYKLEARVNSHNSEGQNSFFVGLDNEAAQGNDSYAYDVSLFNVFTWEEVSKRGTGTSTHAGDQYQPMTWTLSAGQHTFTFYGREPNTWLDQIRLVFVQ